MRSLRKGVDISLYRTATKDEENESFAIKTKGTFWAHIVNENKINRHWHLFLFFCIVFICITQHMQDRKRVKKLD